MPNYVSKMSKDGGGTFDLMDKEARAAVTEEATARKAAILSEATARENDMAEINSAFEKESKVIEEIIAPKIPVNILPGTITTGSVGDVITLNINADITYGHAAIPVQTGDIIKIVSGRGGSTARLWCITDSTLKVLDVSDSGEISDGKIKLTIMQPGYVVMNANINSPTPEIYYLPIKSIEKAKTESLDYAERLTNNSLITLSPYLQNGYTPTNIDYGATVSFARTASDEMKRLIMKCSANDVYIISGTGGTNALLWVFTDNEHKIIEKSSENETASQKVLRSPANGYIICNFYNNSEPSIYRKTVFSDMEKYDNYTYLYTDGKGIRTPDTVGGTVSLIPETLVEGAYCVIDVKAGEKIYHKGRGFDGFRAWCFVDDSLTVVAVSESSVSVDDVLIAPADGKLILNCRISSGWYTSKKVPMTGKDIICGMNGGYNRQFLAPNIPDSYSPTAGSYGAITDILNVVSPTVSALYGLYDDLMERFPTYVSKEELPYKDQSGTYNMYCYTFAPEQMPIHQASVLTFPLNSLPVVLLGGGVHGDGNTGDDSSMIGTIYYFLKDLCENWKNNESLKYLRWNVIIKFIPLQNPWGYQNKTRKNSRGIDINRNMPIGWVYSTETTAAGYGGPEPLSENETKNIKYVMDNNSHAVLYFDIHSRMETVPQSRMMYYDVNDATPMINIFRSSMPYVNAEWKKIDANLPDTINGDMTLDLNGSGCLFPYADSLGINSAIIEGFSNYSGFAGERYDSTITLMLLKYFGTTLFHALRFFQINYFPGKTRIIQ